MMSPLTSIPNFPRLKRPINSGRKRVPDERSQHTAASAANKTGLVDTASPYTVIVAGSIAIVIAVFLGYLDTRSKSKNHVLSFVALMLALAGVLAVMHGLLG